MMRKDLQPVFDGEIKPAQTHGYTILRLELYAIVLATEIAGSINYPLDIPPSNIHFFTDSNVCYDKFPTSPEDLTFMLQIALKEFASSVSHHNSILSKQNVIRPTLRPEVLMQLSF